MTPDERNLLSTFLRDLTQARSGSKDAEADQMIVRALSSNPDAAYLLVQHAILSDQALHEAQARIQNLQDQLQSQAPGQSRGFLGGLFGQSAPPPPAQTAVPSYAPPPNYGQPQASPFSGGGGLGSFLRTAGTTAAGVAGGEMLFEGLSGLFGGHHGGGFGGGYGGGMFGGEMGQPVENVTINEYGDGGNFDDADWSDDD
jgi:hypothetical protein